MILRHAVGPAALACLGMVALTVGLGGWTETGSHGTTTLAADAKPAEKPPGLPPLVISKDAPRLADEPAKPRAPAAGTSQGPVADNSSCYCCHTNYQEESFVQDHAKANVGCVECHGESLAHRNDEDNITPPDVMIAADGIEQNCRKCHDTHDAPAAKVLAMWQQKCPARNDPKELLCTDCHGEHRLKFRSVWWDKKTRELGAREQGERVRWAVDLTKVPAGKTTPAVGNFSQGVAPDTEMH